MKAPRRLLALAACLTAALGVAACSSSQSDSTGSSSAASPTSLTVMGAASTRVINDDLSQLAAGLDSPLELSYNNAGSSTLVQQMADGAPADLFISADQANMDKAIANGSVKEGVTVATNSMVMVVPKGNPAGITSVNDLAGKNVVLCDEQVPCGTVSKKLEEANGITIQAVSLEQSVSDVLGKVVSGEADAGWVYRTDAAAAGDAVEVIDIPHAAENVNSLVAGVVTNSEHPEQAQALLDLLRSQLMAGVWTKHGFTPAT